MVNSYEFFFVNPRMLKQCPFLNKDFFIENLQFYNWFLSFKKRQLR